MACDAAQGYKDCHQAQQFPHSVKPLSFNFLDQGGMAIRHTSKEQDTRPSRKQSYCEKILCTRTPDPKSVDKRHMQTYGKEGFHPKAVLFINHYATDGAHEVHRPNRSTVGSHVQRVIRHNKRINAEFRLKPAILREIRSGYHVGRVGINRAPSIQNQRSLKRS